jgi:signal transduction histidine kinase
VAGLALHNIEPPSAALSSLAVYLSGRRDQILDAWRRAVDTDPELTSSSTITRAQFVDHIPAVLDAFEWRLAARRATERAQAREEQKESAAEHGMHRWQQGYNQPETMREWGHLHLCLLREVEGYVANSDISVEAMQTARRELVRLCSDGMCASAVRYTQLQQSEAASRVKELESALVQLRALEQQRAEVWREAAHDLRGRAQVLANASAALTRSDVSEQLRTSFSDLVRVGVQSLNKLLSDLMDQARLEAGQERRSIAHFDVAALLRDFCDGARPVAAQQNLFLVAKGPATLMVDGDAVKIQRILQNLVLNALKVTERGGVKVTWEAGENERQNQWVLCVQDTGPGYKRSSATPLEKVLKHATDEAHEVEQRNTADSEAAAQADSAPTLASQTPTSWAPVASGEGIGLAIVKRLCELLDASLELESSEGEGTTFRMIFPRRYAEAPGKA